MWPLLLLLLLQLCLQFVQVHPAMRKCHNAHEHVSCRDNFDQTQQRHNCPKLGPQHTPVRKASRAATLKKPNHAVTSSSNSSRSELLPVRSLAHNIQCQGCQLLAEVNHLARVRRRAQPADQSVQGCLCGWQVRGKGGRAEGGLPGRPQRAPGAAAAAPAGKIDSRQRQRGARSRCRRSSRRGLTKTRTCGWKGSMRGAMHSPTPTQTLKCRCLRCALNTERQKLTLLPPAHLQGNPSPPFLQSAGCQSAGS